MTKTFKPIFTITNRITAGLPHIERGRGTTLVEGARQGTQETISTPEPDRRKASLGDQEVMLVE